ncbi:hypothetical protein JCM8202v2_006247 [Rhodotorula sphaerocarpa]
MLSNAQGSLSAPFGPQELAFGDLTLRDTLRVVVVGTGFAGLAAAIACARQGFKVTLAERSAGISPHGDSILFGANASRIFYRWSVGGEMYKRAGSQRGLWRFKDAGGRTVQEQDIGDSIDMYGAPVLQGRRSTFLGSLGTEARLLGISIRLASEVVEYWDSRDEPAVVLRGGEVLRADVIIVADGVHSSSRQLLTSQPDCTGEQELSTGYSIYRSAVSAEKIKLDPRCAHLLDGTIRTWLGPDGHVCTYPLDNGKALAFTYTHRDTGSPASLDWRDKKPATGLLKKLRDWDPVLHAVLSHFSHALHWKIVDQPPEEQWISAGGKICFVGDAVHAMTPTAFQGGSQAIEDGAAIALCLALAGGDPSKVRLALRVFEAVRRPRVKDAQALGREQQDVWHSFASTQRSEGGPGPTRSLRPLSFELYRYDVEAYLLAHFEGIARALDPTFHLKAIWKEDAARNANMPLDVRRLSQADSIEQEEWWRSHAMKIPESDP